MTLLGVLRQCKLTTAAVGAGLLLFPLTSVLATTAPIIALVGDKELASPVQHGISRLTQALQTKGAVVEEAESLPQANAKTVLVFGIGAGNGETAKLISELKLAPLQAAESLCVRQISRDGKAVLLVAGADARGLMYALLDIADRVRWTTPADSPFTEVRDIEEKPYAAERALSLYTFNRTYWESRFYDEAYWARYLDVLAQNRFNSLVVILGYENGGFLAPCYPDFFDVEGFPDVRMMGITPAQQQRNLAALNRLIQMAHGRGVRFTVGIWDHIYRGGVQGGGIPGADEAMKNPTPGLVWGVTAENLVPYTKAALAKFVKEVPVLDGIQFRMHDESGLKNSEQESFWRDVFQQIRVASPNLRLDLRAKRLPDSVIESALEVGVPFRITTKYWMEQMGVIAMKVIGGGNGCLATGNPPQQVLRPYHDQTTHQVQPASLIRYTLSLPVSVAVIGVASVEQLKANIRMVREATPMTVAERRELETAMG